MKKLYEESNISAIADAIRAKNGTSNKYTTAQMAGAISAIEGGTTEDNIQYLTYLNGTFRGAIFPQDYCFVAKVNLANFWNSDCSMAFYQSINLKSIKLIDESNSNRAIDVASLIRNVSTIETVDLTEFSRRFKKVDWLGLGCTNLKSIYGALDFTECTSAVLWLSGAEKIEDIEFVPNTIKIAISFQWCHKLTKATITSIFNGLSSDTADLTVTVSKTAVNKAFETIEGANDGSTSAEWLALIATKQNWTVSLV